MIFVIEVDGGEIKVQDKDGNYIGSTDDGGVRRLMVDAKIAAGNANLQKVYLVDGVNEIELAVADATAIPANTRSILMMARDPSGNARRLVALKDGDTLNGEYGQSVLARDKTHAARYLLSETDGALIVAAKPPSAPPGTTEFVLAGDTPLTIGPVPNYHETVSAAIGNGINLFIQTVSAGAAGDPTENGSKVELYWREGTGPTDHLITRIYLSGQTVNLVTPNINAARDGTQLTGNGTNTYLVIRRERLSTAAQEIDAEVRGYTE